MKCILISLKQDTFFEIYMGIGFNMPDLPQTNLVVRLLLLHEVYLPRSLKQDIFFTYIGE